MSNRTPPEQLTDRLFATERNPEDFRFDASVARVFPDMIRRSVPGYTTIIPMIEVITEQYVQPGSHCYDLGCSLGASTLAMRHGIPYLDCTLVGVDNSEAMIERCEHYVALDDHDLPVTLRCEDILSTELSNASVTTLNFTLQFVPPEQRLALLTRIGDATLPGGVALFHCGPQIVAGDGPFDADRTAVTTAGFQRLVLWDNLYCNDYCPRRLFVGPYRGRTGINELMLNGTGMVETDLMLLSVIQAGDDERCWQTVLRANGVPEAFFALAPWFDAPVISGTVPKALPAPDAEQMAAIEHLLWRWKTSLAREWYPYLFGLKHDALIAAGEMPGDRLAKTQTAPLHQHLEGWS